MEATQVPMKEITNFPEAKQPRQFVVDLILPKRGILVMAGGTGMGRTFEALHLLASIEKGERWHGFQAYKDKCWYLYREHGRDDYVAKGKKILAVRGSLKSEIRFDQTENFYINTEQGLANIIKYAEDARVIFLDPLYLCIYGDWYRSRQVLADTILGLGRLQSAGYTIVILQNVTKDSNGIVIRGAMGEDKLTIDKMKAPAEFGNTVDTAILYAVTKTPSAEKIWVETGRFIGIPKHTASDRQLGIKKVRWDWQMARYDGKWDIWESERDALTKYLIEAPEDVRTEAEKRGIL